jgi:hypothetical protein
MSFGGEISGKQYPDFRCSRKGGWRPLLARIGSSPPAASRRLGMNTRSAERVEHSVATQDLRILDHGRHRCDRAYLHRSDRPLRRRRANMDFRRPLGYARPSILEALNGTRHREVVQFAKRIRVHSAAGRRERRLRSYLGRRKGRSGRPEGSTRIRSTGKYLPTASMCSADASESRIPTLSVTLRRSWYSSNNTTMISAWNLGLILSPMRRLLMNSRGR